MMKRKILGDFQTPLPLARQILSRLSADGFLWSRVLEPTCGKGHFIRAVADLGMSVEEIIGIEIQSQYVKEAESANAQDRRVRIVQCNLFDINLSTDLSWKTEGPVLVIGNPPWVTNAAQGALGGDNLPLKSNFKGFSGLDALTGKANFDIAEYIWIKLIHELKQTDSTIALLCKTSVARNVLKYLHDTRTPVKSAAMYNIDSWAWFGVAVDACLFVLGLGGVAGNYDMAVFPSLDASETSARVGFVGNKLVADVDTFQDLSRIDGRSPVEWRQGVKHDASSVMELKFTRRGWENKLGDPIDVEEDYIFPLLKSSDIQRFPQMPRRGVIITQRYVGQDTGHLKHTAPKLWAYLNKHNDVFQGRRSSIYKNKPSYSIFGVGDYTFSEYKVMVSGFYKQPRFIAVGPLHGKPTICDDTCYMLPFDSLRKVMFATALLNHPMAQTFITSLYFPDSKRPITKALLSRVDMRALVRHIPLVDIQQDIKNIGKVLLEDDIALPVSQDEIIQLLFPEPMRLL